MIHPYGRCEECGERVYAHIDGDWQCPNCGARVPADEGDEEGDDGGDGTRTPIAPA
ncbi:hypothetical protein ACFQGT_09550 [Natrialbaceae archaeon GCM10025810]|uniref:hypothetical protein n=1 Tax=Halovalidus salilacus TaxID=3075124 RepID=UPI00360BABF2